ncbi:WD40 repeat-like protein [Mycena leptocephala]|nr:WD40 repeat-like protein [Mycena leptocephala]
MSPASPSPTSPSTKPRTRQRMKRFFRGLLRPSSQKASASTMTLDVYQQDADNERGSQPRASLNDLRTHEQATSGLMPTSLSGTAVARSLLVPGSVPAEVDFNQRTTDSVRPPPHAMPPARIPSPNPASAQVQGEHQSFVLKENAKLAWHGFKVVAKNVERFVDGTPFKIPIAVLNKLVENADAFIDNKESMAKLLLPIGQRLKIVSEALTQMELPSDIRPTFDHFASTLEEATEELDNLDKQGLLKRILELDEHPKEIDDIFRRVDEATKNFELKLNLANFKQANTIRDDIEITRLEKLQPIKTVRFNTLDRKPPVKPCTTGTREELIQGIMSWCKDTSPDAPAIYWLSGMAGTGKTTIAYTICARLSDEGKTARLGASFFCWRQSEAGRKRRNIIPTLAHELALQLPGFRRTLLDSRADANPPPLENHLETLIITPWDMSTRDREGLPPLVVVVDALDEVEDNEDDSNFLEDLIHKIEGHQDHLRGLKFLVTSRRDHRIVEAGKLLPSGAIYRLEEVPTTAVEKDISIYLQASLPLLDQHQLDQLGGQASGLFIYAATAVRFIIPPSQRPPPSLTVQNERLQTLLKAWPDKSRRGTEGLLVDRLYEDILSRYLVHMPQEHQKQTLTVLHTVLYAEEPIVVSDIHQLLKLDEPEPKLEVEDVLAVLLGLHAVLYISPTNVVYLYHKSFIDFMFDPTRFVNQELASICCPSPDIQFRLAGSCFRLMSSLKFNICDLPSSFLDDSEIKDLSTRIKNRISSPLRYACRHWAAHLSNIPGGDWETRQDIIYQMQRWLCTRLLFWMEAMNLLNAIGGCYHALVAVRRWLGTEEMEIQKGLTAAASLVTIFGSSTTKESTPHLYLSALAATSRHSPLMETWHNKFPGIPTVVAVLNPGRLLSLLQHDGWVTSVGFSQDGSRAISGSGDKTVRIWEVSTGMQLHHLDGHEDRVWSVAFSQDGSRAISSSSDQTGHEARVRSVAFSQDGLRAISGSDDRTVRIWEVSTAKQVRQLDGHEDWVKSVAFSQDGSLAISGSDDRTVRIWDVSTGKQLGQLEGKDPVWSVAFSQDGSRAISGSDDRTVRIWEVSTAKPLLQLEGHKKRVLSVAFSPDGLRAISGSEDRTVRIWEVYTGKQLYQLDGHEDSVTSVGFSQDGLYLISGSSDNTVRIWEVPTEKQLGHYHGVNSVGFLPDGSRAISSSYDGPARISEVSTGKQPGQLNGHEGRVNSVGFSEDGSLAISASDDETVRIWDVSTGMQLHQLDGHEDRVWSVAFSQDGSRAISSSSDQTLRIWEVPTGKQLHRLEGHKARVRSVAFSQDGLHAISGSDDKTVRIWEVSTGKQLCQLDGHEDWVISVAFSQDGLRAISGSEDTTVCIWDVATGKQLCRDEHKDWASSVALAQLHQLEGRKKRVLSVAFSHDGLRAISGSEDKTVRIWEVPTGKQMHQLDGHEGGVNSVAFSQDGSRVISGSNDNSVRIWRLLQLGIMVFLHPLSVLTSTDAQNAEWHMKPNGWITSSSNQRWMWLPPDMCRFLETPRCLIISARGSVKVGFTNARVGPEWAQCYDSTAA